MKGHFSQIEQFWQSWFTGLGPDQKQYPAVQTGGVSKGRVAVAVAASDMRQVPPNMRDVTCDM